MSEGTYSPRSALRHLYSKVKEALVVQKCSKFLLTPDLSIMDKFYINFDKNKRYFDIFVIWQPPAISNIVI